MGQDPNFTKSIKIFDMLSKMHAKDSFWTFLFFKIFLLCIIIVISRKKSGDKNVKSAKSLKSDRF